MSHKTFTVTEVATFTGLDKDMICICLSKEWILPTSPDMLDEEDISRLHLIRDLLIDFDVNEESIPLILHLVDQLNHHQNLLREQIEINKKHNS